MDAKAINQRAAAAFKASDRNTLALLAKDLAERQLTALSKPGYRRAPADPELRKEFLAVMIAAGVERAYNWTPEQGDFYRTIGKAIRGAFDEHARAGGYSNEVIWRGPYSTHKRKFASQVSEKHKQTAAGNDLEAQDTGEPGEPPADVHLPHTAAAAARTTRDQVRAAEGAAEGTGDDAEGAAEGTGDDAKGLASATHGLFSGTLKPNSRALAVLEAFESLPPVERHFYEAVDRANGLERYIQQNRQRQADHLRAKYQAVVKRWHTKAQELAKVRKLGWGDEPAPGWRGGNTPDPGDLLRNWLAGSGSAPRPQGKTVSGSGAPIMAADGREWRTVYRSPDGRTQVRVSGLGWRHLVRNVRAWNHSPNRPESGSPLSLLDSLADLVDEWGNPRRVVQVVQPPRSRCAWPAVRLVIAVSLLDTV